jgi:hypothetical protein
LGNLQNRDAPNYLQVIGHSKKLKIWMPLPKRVVLN